MISMLYLKSLYFVKMKDGSSIADHLNAFNMIIIQLPLIDVKFENEDKCILFLCLNLGKIYLFPLVVVIQSQRWTT